MYRMWTTAANQAKIGNYQPHSHTVRRTYAIGLLLLYAFASASPSHAAVIIKRDVEDHWSAAAVTLAGNGTTETPATTAATVRRADPSVGNDLFDTNPFNGTAGAHNSESNENNNNDNAIASLDQKTIYTQDSHQIVGHDVDAPEQYDEPDESLGAKDAHKK